jgi:ribonucleoside-diphosphate reductase alpha chain
MLDGDWSSDVCSSDLSGTVKVTQGSLCAECGNMTVIRKDGCDFCTACGAVGTCG